MQAAGIRACHFMDGFEGFARAGGDGFEQALDFQPGRRPCRRVRVRRQRHEEMVQARLRRERVAFRVRGEFGAHFPVRGLDAAA